MAGIAMAAHQSEEKNGSSYSLADIKSSNTATEKHGKPNKTLHKHSASFSGTQLKPSSDAISPTLSAFTPNSVTLKTTSNSTKHIYENSQNANGFSNTGTGNNIINGEHSTGYKASTSAFAGNQNRGYFMQSAKRINSPAVSNALNPLINARIYGKDDRSNSPISAYHEQQMRKSMHRLVSATTRFDKVTAGALSLLSDVARLYLLRIGEACRTRTDLASRTEPSLYDVIESTSFDLGVDWSLIGAWVDEWKNEVGDVIAQNEVANERTPVYASLLKESGKLVSTASDFEHPDEQSQTRRNSLALAGGPAQSTNSASASAAASDVGKALMSMRRLSLDGAEPHLGSETTCNGNGDRVDAEVATEMMDDDGLDEMIDGLNLGCLLLDETDMAEGTQAITMPHLPPLAMPLEEDEDDHDCDHAQNSKQQTSDGMELDVPAKEMRGPSSNPVGQDNNALGAESDAEDSPENVMAQLLHLTTASLSSLHPSIASDKPLYAFFRPAAKFDSTCAPDDVLPDFDIPEVAYAPAPKRIEQRLSQISRLEPGKPMFVIKDTEERDVVGDSEKMWRQARIAMYQEIFEQTAEHAIEEMDSAPPLFIKRFNEKDLDLLEQSGSNLLVIESAGQGESDGTKAGLEKSEDNRHSDANSSEFLGEVVGIDEDVLDLEMGTDMDMDIDLDLDFDNELDIVSNNVKIKAASNNKDSTADSRDTDIKQDSINSQSQKDSQDRDFDEKEKQLNLPVSSGLRGSGKPHWSKEWFTSAMGKRLTTMTALDIVPFDSLFVANPWASRRSVVDEVARAFVDSEGGGHLHATTPLEGFGPAANTYTVPNSSGSALRWTLHHIMQSKNTNKVDSLYMGRSSLAGGVSGDGVSQYIGRMCSLIKASVEEEAELVVNGALGISKSKQEAKLKAALDQGEMIEQLIVGADKRIPWAQNRLDIHVIESRIANREPQRAESKRPSLPPPAIISASRSATSSATPALPTTASLDHQSATNSSENQSMRELSPLQTFSVPERRDSEIDVGGEVVEHNATPPPPCQDQGQDQDHGLAQHPEEGGSLKEMQQEPLNFSESTVEPVELPPKSEQGHRQEAEEDIMFI
ncbi:hypothetical protein LPJ64_004096 [Coemansia asiatica]|uniref:Bromodomain associated domain-containing protein n=1 Tax=Coemansia asiatica TaxID=1052880 RepID=A0A9W8CHL6_9FUNG|nr:hypothetical protein LPJ64_004096 [Coemansia asiatica]